MLVDNFSSDRAQGANTPNFTQSYRIQNIYEEILIENISFFTELSIQHLFEPTNEDRYNQDFYIEMVRYFSAHNRGVILIPEFKDYVTTGANRRKRVDFAFISAIQGASTRKLYTVEAKRLPTDKSNGDRETEYVYGQSKKDSGGIERFKTGSHGYQLPKSALLGYIEEEDFGYWHGKINEWISNKASSTPSEWNINEQLTDLFIDASQGYSITHSIANRESNSINLFHLWVKIPN